MQKYLLVGLLVGYLGSAAMRNHVTHTRNVRYQECDAQLALKFDRMSLENLQEVTGQYHTCLLSADFTSWEKAITLNWEY